MKKAIIIFGFLITIFGCSSDSQTENNNDNNSYKLVQINEDDMNVNFGTTTKFYYSNNKISKIEFSQNGTDFYNKTTNFIYENDKVKKLNFFKYTNSLGSDTFTYSGNNIQSCFSTQYSTETSNNYLYNSSNYLTNHKIYDEFNTLTNDFNYSYFSNGNIENFIPIQSTGGALNTTYEYDGNKNPLTLVYDENLIKIFFESKNNITKKTVVNHTYTYEYIYNDKGYPIQKIEKDNGLQTTKTTYTYQ